MLSLQAEMLGTIVNTACIVVGTLVGTLFKKGFISACLLYCIGTFSILEIKDCKTLNYIPALLVPIVWFLVKGLIPANP